MDGSPPEPGKSVSAIEAAATARAAGLHYVSDDTPGIRRLGDAGAFRYLGAHDQAITDDATLDRIRMLAIPPAYVDVWICPAPLGHLQATGRDARGRKQYRYHAEWRSARDGTKFDRMVEFGEALPRLRRRIRRDLALPGLPREKVLALIVALLDATRLRIGNRSYARDNRSFGLTTLRGRHATFTAGRLRLSFRGKGGTDHDLVVDDKKLARIVRRCQELPGQQLFQYLDDAGERRGIDSGMVNDYLRDAAGSEFTAKDFRTWGATLRAIALMACTPLPEPPSERALKTCIVAAIREVATELRNTPAVCRKAYINPVVFAAWREGSLHRVVSTNLSASPRKAETLALKFLRSQARAARLQASRSARSSARRSRSVRAHS
ncbi:MAG: DNA topoisomerase IB [Panacagrimonas sp.]